MESGTEAKVLVSVNGRRTLAGKTVPANWDEEWMRLLLRISPVAIFRSDAEGNCTYVNERWCEMTGRPMEAALGVGWQLSVHPEDVPLVVEEWERSGREGTEFSMEHRYVRADGAVIWVLGQIAEERDEQGRGSLVEFYVDAKIKKIRYLTRYFYDLDNGRFGWDYVSGDLKECTGRYDLVPQDDGSTAVTVNIETEIGFFVPGPMKKLIRDQSLKNSMRDLRKRVEK